MENKMFCYQCQETAGCTGCTRVGVCGKKPDVAAMQDLLVYVTKGLSAVTTALRKEGAEVRPEINHLITLNLFTTITNANFDKEAIVSRIRATLDTKKELLLLVKNMDQLPDAALWSGDDSAFEPKAATVGVLSTENEDIRSLRELITYGLKGLSAYSKHANVLLEEDVQVDAFLQRAYVRPQRRLISNSRRNAAQQGRYFRAGLNETENIIDEQEHVLMFFITEIFSHRKARQADAHTGSGRFVHLAVYESGLADNARFLHFVPQVIAFAGPFAYAGKYGIAAVFRRNVVNQFHDENGLAYAGAAEQADLAAFGIRSDEVDDLNARFENFRTRRLVFKFRSRPMDRPIIFSFYYFVYLVDGLTENVENTSQHALANGNLNGAARIFRSHAAYETICRTHSNAADDVVA